MQVCLLTDKLQALERLQHRAEAANDAAPPVPGFVAMQVRGRPRREARPPRIGGLAFGTTWFPSRREVGVG